VSRDMIIALAVPVFVAWALIAMLRRSKWAAGFADEPNERSLHAVPTPRIGGLGLAAAALPVAALVSSNEIAIVLACAAALCLVSLVDDVRDLAIPVRLAAQATCIVVAMVALSAADAAHARLGAVEAAFAFVAVLWMTNLFNFMDGSDGLAGGMALIGFAAFAAGAWAAQEIPLALASAAVASAAAGFLVHNFPPARVFMGDAGSVPLGFLAGALGLYGIVREAWPAWFPLVVFSPFIVDATVTLARRVARGERPWRAHRSHYYQRLVLAGWSQRRLALCAYALMGLAAVAALLGRAAGPAIQLGILLGCAALYLPLLIAIERRAPRAVTTE